MKIIIAGAGKIGYAIAEALSIEGHDITIIDKSSAAINRASNELDIICVEGSATNSETLLEAGVAEADILVAATISDEVNMICGISARKLGTPHVVARIRDTEYLMQRDFLREALGLSVIVNPEFECAKEISRMLRFPNAVRVVSFSKGSVEIVEHRVENGDRLDGLVLKNLGGLVDKSVLISFVERDGKAIIPNGDFVLRGGDRLSITGSPKGLRKFFAAVGKQKKRIKSVMIMGGGRIAVYLANLLHESGMSVTIIEKSRTRCDQLCDLVPEARIICGDATRSDVLVEEGIRSTDAFVSLTGEDADNVITSIYAQSCQVDTIVTKVNREHFAEITENFGLDRVVAPKDLVAQKLALYVRAMDASKGSSMETLYKMADGQVEALEFRVMEDSRCIGKSLRELHIRAGILICAIIRGNRSIIPDGNTQILPGDHAVVVSAAGRLDSLDAILEDKA